jgi:glycosyltransferase involved in cell wall biosynthesis
LINAFALLRRDFHNSILMIVGGGEDIENLQKQAADLGLTDTCVFIGRVPPEEIPIYYALADVSTDPVHDNPAARGRSPLKLFESWISGVPFVSADVGERPYLLGEPPAGVLVAPGSEGSFARGISKILLDTNLASTLTTRGKALSKKYYWSTLVLTLEDLFTTHFNNKRKQ